MSTHDFIREVTDIVATGLRCDPALVTVSLCKRADYPWDAKISGPGFWWEAKAAGPGFLLVNRSRHRSFAIGDTHDRCKRMFG